jgi:hypothetical protein
MSPWCYLAKVKPDFGRVNHFALTETLVSLVDNLDDILPGHHLFNVRFAK